MKISEMIGIANTVNEAKNFFGRIGTRQNIDEVIAMMRKADCPVTEDKSAGTVMGYAPFAMPAANPPIAKGQCIMRALHKGDGFWIVMYHRGAFPEDSCHERN